MSERPTSALSAVGLRIAFAGPDRPRLVISDVSFSVSPRQRLAIIGESGTGKTVTALTLCGLLEAHPGLIGGQVWLDGTNIYAGLDRFCHESSGNGDFSVRKSRFGFQAFLRRNVRPKARAALSLVFQEAKETLDPLRTVEAQLIEALRQKLPGTQEARLREEATRLLARLGFEDPGKTLGSYPHELSGGMAQRVGIALALAVKPSILLADEPTSSLDAILQKQVADLLLELHRDEAWALILITHNLRLARYVAELILVMYGGVIVETVPAPLIGAGTHRFHPYTEHLLEAGDELYGASTAPGSGARLELDSPLPDRPRPERTDGPCPFAARCSLRTAEHSTRALDCERAIPPLTPASGEPGHYVRCWLYGRPSEER